MFDLVIKGGTIVDGTGSAPITGDIAVTDGKVIEVGERIAGNATRTVDADGLVVAPGWVDVHTHYDGQVTWDPEVSPSSWHGATTVVMGNCGVGFAPLRPEGRDFLVELMEGIEDIPGTALHEGIDWSWETFGEYLDCVAKMPRVMDVAAQVPHSALRAYVMGERAHEEATYDEIQAMAKLAEQGLRDGAVGITTARTILHRSIHGIQPGSFVPSDEILAIGEALGTVGHGVFQLVSDAQGRGEEGKWLEELARRTGATVSYALAQDGGSEWRSALDDASALQADGAQIMPMVPSRPTGMLFGLQSSLHPFTTHATYRAMADLPLAERVARLRQPEVRAQLLSEGIGTKNAIAGALMSRWHAMFPLGDDPNYEPAPAESAASVASASGRRPEEVVLDWLLEREGKALLFAPLANYNDTNLDAIREMLVHPSTVSGLSDGGAHCGLICDASMTTFLLTHWVKGRTRGETIPLETAVAINTGRTAKAWGFKDRGTLVPGKRADVNLIDLDGLRLHSPEMVHDLPAGGRRLVQHVDGYVATFVAGQQTYASGEPTGARPGQLVRGGR